MFKRIIDNSYFQLACAILFFFSDNIFGSTFKLVFYSLFMALFARIFINSIKESDLSYEHNSIGRYHLRFVPIAFAAYIFIIAASYLINLLTPLVQSENQTSIKDSVAAGGPETLFMLIAMIFVAPFVEELMFRRLLLGNPMEYVEGQWKIPSTFIRLIAGTMAFPFVHVIAEVLGLFSGDVTVLSFLLAYLAYLPTSIALSFLYLKYKTIWASFTLHFINNAIGAIAMLFL